MRKQRVNKTENICAYMQSYRQENIDVVKAQEVTRYYRKRYDIPADVAATFGDCTGYAWKTLLSVDEILDKVPAEYKSKLLNKLAERLA